MLNSKWDNVPLTTPACTMFIDTPCCNCGDCRRKTEKIQLTEDIILTVEIYEYDDTYNVWLEFYNTKKKERISEIDFYSNEFDMDLSKFRIIMNNVINCFEPVEFQSFTSLDDFR